MTDCRLMWARWTIIHTCNTTSKYWKSLYNKAFYHAVPKCRLERGSTVLAWHTPIYIYSIYIYIYYIDIYTHRNTYSQTQLESHCLQHQPLYSNTHGRNGFNGLCTKYPGYNNNLVITAHLVAPKVSLWTRLTVQHNTVYAIVYSLCIIHI